MREASRAGNRISNATYGIDAPQAKCRDTGGND
jgi:hypothetical protein